MWNTGTLYGRALSCAMFARKTYLNRPESMSHHMVLGEDNSEPKASTDSPEKQR